MDNLDDTTGAEAAALSPPPDTPRDKFTRTRSAVALQLARATVEGVQNRRAFRDVKHFVFFIGYPHSGSSLIGSLLNCHPEAVISHETDILRFVRPGITRQQLFALVLDGDRRFAAVGRRWMHIDYDFPGTHQGTYEHLLVVGDKMAHRSSLRIEADPTVLERLRRVVGVPIRVLYLTRNPFDNIASLAAPSLVRRPNASLSKAFERYRRFADAVYDVIPRLEPDELLHLSYESVSADPARRMSEICQFIGVSATDSFLETCTSAIRPGASRSRERITWPPEERQRVEELIATHPTLDHYTFDD